MKEVKEVKLFSACDFCLGLNWQRTKYRSAMKMIHDDSSHFSPCLVDFFIVLLHILVPRRMFQHFMFWKVGDSESRSQLPALDNPLELGG